MRRHQRLGLSSVRPFLAVTGNVAADAYHFVLAPAAVCLGVFLPALVAPSVQADHQQPGRIDRSLGITAFALRLALPVTLLYHPPAQRFAPTLDLLAIQIRFPVPVQRLGRIVKAPA